jgi:hypothetical protein
MLFAPREFTFSDAAPVFAVYAENTTTIPVV